MFTEMLINTAIAVVIVGCYFGIKKLAASYRFQKQLLEDLHIEYCNLLAEYQKRVGDHRERMELLFPYCTNYFISLPATMHHKILESRQELQWHIRQQIKLQQCMHEGGIKDIANAIAQLKLLLGLPIVQLGSAPEKAQIVAAEIGEVSGSIDPDWESKIESMIQAIGAELCTVSAQAGEFSPQTNPTGHSLEESLTLARIKIPSSRKHGNQG
jgi:hypothetical protein